jgi:hypothetical protein
LRIVADTGLRSAQQVFYLLIPALGVGFLFQAPLIAIQAAMPLRDMATSTAAFGLIRTIGGTVGISVGEAIFSSVRPFSEEMPARLTSAQVLRTKISKLGSLPGINTSSSGLNEAVRIIHTLPDPERTTLTHAFESSLGTVWLVITPVVAFGFLCSACAPAPRTNRS